MASAAGAVSSPSLQSPHREIAQAPWTGPTSGPQVIPDQRIVFIAADLRNEGISTVSDGLRTAGRVLKWNIQVDDGASDANRIRKHLQQALLKRVDAIVLGGFDPEDYQEELKKAHSMNIKIVGWHASPVPGPGKNLFTNVTTVLEILHVPISQAEFRASEIVQTLQEKYGLRWTHTLAINDIYFDHMNFPLKKAGRKDVVNISAGDGSPKALSRIESGFSQHVAAIAEPLHAQGWQIADELNRAFANEAPSGFVTQPLIITKDFLKTVKSKNLDSGLPFEEAYKKIWFSVKPSSGQGK